ncbi:MAG: radical SAM protein [Candidatus Thermoplasmatota archaeon]|nr:radical SAM protein [Candidatus Thermoplasmatota archaeon]
MYNLKYKLPVPFLVYALKLARYEKLVKLDDKIVFSSFVPPFPSKAFDRFVASFSKKTPTAVYTSLTNKCKYNCWHCSNMYRSGKELTSKEVIKLLKDFQDLGASVFGFTGGEPLLRNDLPEIIRAVDERGITLLFTSGDGFTNKKAEELKKAGLFSVVISLDHFKGEVHNALREQKDAFKTALDAIQTSKKYGFYTTISTVVTKQLLDTIFEFLEFAQKLGVDEVRVLEPIPCGKLLTEETTLDDKDRAKLIEVHKIANKSSKYPRVSAFSYIESEQAIGCTAGIDHLYIDAEGNVCPCDFTPLSFGNVKEEELKKILERLHNYFTNPREKCFMIENYKEIAKCFEGKLPLPIEKSIEICKSCKPSATPTFYKKLGLSAFLI